jgi:hypothetical protein
MIPRRGFSVDYREVHAKDLNAGGAEGLFAGTSRQAAATI